MDFQFASFCLIVSEYHTFVFPESSEYMKYAMISVFFFNISLAFSTPITINAVAYASAVAQSLASTVAESRLCCTGLPVLGSIVWAYFSHSYNKNFYSYRLSPLPYLLLSIQPECLCLHSMCHPLACLCLFSMVVVGC